MSGVVDTALINNKQERQRAFFLARTEIKYNGLDGWTVVRLLDGWMAGQIQRKL
jgi:hypothetical protein